MSSEAATAIDRYLAPISPEAPAGTEPREARADLKDQVGSAAVDWSKVAERAGTELTTAGKDLQIACYFAFARLNSDGIAGLAEGLAVLAGLLDRYWETGFPAVERVRVRAASIAWLSSRVAAELEATPREATDAVRARVTESLRALEAAVSTRFDAGAVDLRPMQAALGGVEAAASPTPGSESESATPEEPSAVTEDPFAARLRALKEPFARAIDAESPAGENAQYHPEYEAARAEIDKLGRLEAHTVNWALVHENTRTLLTERTKDLRVGCYFAVAAFEERGFAGLLEGIAAIIAMTENYHADGFPKGRARPSSLRWFVERIAAIRELAPKPEHADDLEALEHAAKELTTVVQATFDAPPPSTRKLRDAIERLRSSIASTAKAPEQPRKPEVAPTFEPSAGTAETKKAPVSDATAPAKPAPAPAKKKALAVDDPGDAPTDPAQVTGYLKKTAAALHKVSRTLVAEQIGDATAYRIARVALYMYIKQAPPVRSGAETQTDVPAPALAQAERFESLLEAKNWQPLLAEAEGALKTARMWMDLHRFVFQALVGLGHQDAAEAVRLEIANVTSRMPELLERAFVDGRPFADPQTREWIRSSSSGPPGEGRKDTGGSDSGDGLEDELAAAHKLAVGGKLEAALDRLSALAESEAVRGRDRFRAKLAM
ncbi:MAG: type VI secretion system protein TssA, partial [Myxococcota bacterium]